MGITMIDTSVFGALNRALSSKGIAAALHELAASGETLMVCNSTLEEIRNTPEAWLRDAQLRQIEDFKMQIQQPATAAEHTIGEQWADAVVDKTGTKLRWQAAGIQPKDLPIASDVKVQMARSPGQNVKLYTVERMANNQAAITKTYGIEFSKKSRQISMTGDKVPYNPEALGVEPSSAPKSAPVVEEVAPPELPPPVAPEVPIVRPPSVGAGRLVLDSVKAGLKEGWKGIWSAETLVGIAAELFIAYADKVAAKTAIRNIQISFIKDGFAKGLAAGVMGWTEDEVAGEAMNRVTEFRLEGMADAAGHLKLDYMYKLATAYENYAVGVGYYWAYQKPLGWKKDVREKGLAYLKRTGYDNWGPDEDVLYHYEFLAKLAWALRQQSDEFVEAHIRVRD